MPKLFVRASVCAVLAFTALAAPQRVAPAAAAPGDATRVTLIGDSTMAAMRWYAVDDDINRTISDSYDLVFDAESCRRLVVESCVGRTDPSSGTRWRPISVLPLIQTKHRGELGEALVIMAGYDDWLIAPYVDQVMAEATAQGVPRVLWLNLRTSSAYQYGSVYASHNAELQAARVRHPNLEVLDWNGYTRALPAETQRLWFTSDDIHLTRTGAFALAGFIKTALDERPIARCLDANATTGVADPVTGTQAPAPVVGTGLVPLAPQRVLDTRGLTIAEGGKVGTGRTVAIDLDQTVPADTQAVALSVTAADPCRSGYLTVFPCGTRPITSTVNYVAGRTTAGMAISVMTDRKVCVYASTPTDLIIDVTAAFTPSGGLFHPVTPTRWVDTRDGSALLPGPIGLRSAETEFEVPVGGSGGVPAGATAAWFNVTAVAATGYPGVLVYPGPCGAAPLASTVNVLAGRAGSSAALVGLGTRGSICVRTFGGAAHVVLDLAGWFGPGENGLVYRGQAPTRILDTRSGGQPAARTDLALPIGAASVLNVAAIDSSASGWVSVKPCGATALSSVLNSLATETIANVTAVAPGAGGSACLYSSTAAHMLADVTGTFVPPG